MQALEKIKAKKGIKDKVTFVGRLDPMACGLFLALSGKDRFKKDKLNKLDKEYRVRILFGVSTDTGDILGMLNSAPCDSVNLSGMDLRLQLKKLEGKIEWQYPCFSSKSFKGKQLLWHSLKGECPKDRPSYKGEIYKIKFLSLTKISQNELEAFVFNRLSATSASSVKSQFNDFRVEEIKKSWRKFFKESKVGEFHVLEIKVTSSKSVYMRDLAEKLGVATGVPAVAIHIERLSFGRYVKIFGKIGVFLRKY